jgi:hypothetical protein
MRVASTASSGPTNGRTHEYATRFIASVEFLVKITPSSGASRKRAMARRPLSYMSVASSASPYTPRWTLDRDWR